jgi:arylsulfatase A-like enzyme
MNTGYLLKEMAFNQGFDRYLLAPGTGRAAFADTAHLMTEKTLRDWRDDRPFFLFVNYMDAHPPMNRKERPGLLPRPLVPRAPAYPALTQAVINNEPLPADKKRIVEDWYDTGIAHIDEAIGKLIATLKELGQFDNTVFVVTSDHGESFGENGVVGHTQDLYQTLIHVPLIVRTPGQTAGRDVTQATTLVDVPRMIVDAIPAIPAAEADRIYPDRVGTRPVLAEVHFARFANPLRRQIADRYMRERTAIIVWPYKYIDSTDDEHELYHLERDPAELVNLLTAQPATARSMKRTMMEFMSTRKKWGGPKQELIVTERSRKHQIDLGYLKGNDEDDEGHGDSDSNGVEDGGR